jgi:large subunit ribosomal protein L9
MQVILNEDVAHLGEVGDIVDVADGYGRNFLIPRKLALPATSRNVKQLEHTKRQIATKRAKMMKTASEIAAKLADVSLMISKAVGEEDKLFGSVTNRDIADALNSEGFNIDRRQVLLNAPIRNLGVYTVDLKLHSDVTAQIKVWVVAE